MNPEQPDDPREDTRDPGQLEKLLTWSKRNARLVLLLGGGFLFVVAGLAAALLNVSLPWREVKIVGVALLVAVPWGHWLYHRARTLLVPDQYGTVLVELDAEDPEHGRVIGYRPGAFDVETEDGTALDWTSPDLAFAKRVDLAEDGSDHAVGTWRGSASGRELLRSLTKVREIRNLLEDDARRGFVLETSLFAVVRSATVDATKRVVDTFEDATLPDAGQGIEDAIDRSLDQFGLEDDPGESDDGDDGGQGEAARADHGDDPPGDTPATLPHPAGGSDD